MKTERSTIAIIPARAGSKGLPGKNIKNLNGKPLIVWTIEQALKTQNIDIVVVSTDCPKIAAIAKEHGALVPFLRPGVLATDTASSYSVVEHCLDYFKIELCRNFDVVALLEPTQPLREPGDLKLMLDLLAENYDHFDSVMAVGGLTHHPALALKVDEAGGICGYEKDSSKELRRQDLSELYYAYGTFIVKTDEIQKNKSFYPARTIPYKLKRYQCFEIDDIYDFLVVESIMKHEWELL